MQAPPPADQRTPMERLARYFAELLGRRDHLQIDASPERSRLVRVCVRDGWDARGGLVNTSTLCGRTDHLPVWAALPLNHRLT